MPHQTDAISFLSFFSDNKGYHQPSDTELHPSETVEEKISLSERFGLWLSFYPFKQEQYLEIATQAATQLLPQGRTLGSHDDELMFQKAALQFSLERGSRSARIAHHFARQWVGQLLLNDASATNQ